MNIDEEFARRLVGFLAFVFICGVMAGVALTLWVTR